MSDWNRFVDTRAKATFTCRDCPTVVQKGDGCIFENLRNRSSRLCLECGERLKAKHPPASTKAPEINVQLCEDLLRQITQQLTRIANTLDETEETTYTDQCPCGDYIETADRDELKAWKLRHHQNCPAQPRDANAKCVCGSHIQNVDYEELEAWEEQHQDCQPDTAF